MKRMQMIVEKTESGSVVYHLRMDLPEGLSPSERRNVIDSMKECLLEAFYGKLDEFAEWKHFRDRQEEVDGVFEIIESGSIELTSDKGEKWILR